MSSSQLKVALGSPFYYKAFVLDGVGKKETTKQLTFGSLAHKLILEPEDFENEYTVMPYVGLDMRKKADKERLEAFTKEHAGKTVVSMDDMEKAIICRDSVMAHPDAKRLLELPGVAESSVYVEIEHVMPDGEVVPFKVRVRPDKLSPDNCIIDLKTAKNASKDAFIRDAFGTWRSENGKLNWGHYSYHYDLSSALYTLALEKLDQKVLPFYWIVVKNEQPHETAVYKMSTKRYKDGLEKLKYAMTTIITAQRTNDWTFQKQMEEI